MKILEQAGEIARSGRPQDAVRLIEQAAEAGDPDGNFLVAHWLLYGSDRPRDAQGACRHLEQAAEGGKPEAARGPEGRVIPENIITRAPTAELRENQTDQDSLPPYDVLDAILERLVEREEPLASIIAAGFPADVVTRIDRLLNIAEYKRRQAAPGVKVTEKNFGRDRRYPITNRFRDNGKALPEPDEKLVSRAGRVSAEAFEG